MYAGMNILEMQRFDFNLKYSTFKLKASCLSKEGHIQIINVQIFGDIKHMPSVEQAYSTQISDFLLA